MMLPPIVQGFIEVLQKIVELLRWMFGKMGKY
jgi:hypothetical protein